MTLDGMCKKVEERQEIEHVTVIGHVLHILRLSACKYNLPVFFHDDEL